MATQTKAGKVWDVYLALIHRFPLRPIRSEGELDDAQVVIDSLLDRASLEAEEQDYLDILSNLVKDYETRAYPITPVSDAALLRHLMEAKGKVSQTKLARETAISVSTISEVLSGKRQLTRQQIGRLSGYFAVNPGAFTFG